MWMLLKVWIVEIAAMVAGEARQQAHHPDLLALGDDIAQGPEAR